MNEWMNECFISLKLFNFYKWETMLCFQMHIKISQYFPHEMNEWIELNWIGLAYIDFANGLYSNKIKIRLNFD